MRIGELSERTNTPPETIRYYEKLNLIKPTERAGKGHRHYDTNVVARLNKINFLKQLGLSLEDIGGVIDLYFEDPQGLKGKKAVLEVLRAQREEAQNKLEAIKQFIDELDTDIERIGSLVEDLNRKS